MENILLDKKKRNVKIVGKLFFFALSKVLKWTIEDYSH